MTATALQDFRRPSDMTPVERVCNRAYSLVGHLSTHGPTVIAVATGRTIYRHAKAVLPEDLAACFKPCTTLANFNQNQFADAAALVSGCITNAMQKSGEWEML